MLELAATNSSPWVYRPFFLLSDESISEAINNLLMRLHFFRLAETGGLMWLLLVEKLAKCFQPFDSFARGLNDHHQWHRDQGSDQTPHPGPEQQRHE